MYVFADYFAFLALCWVAIQNEWHNKTAVFKNMHNLAFLKCNGKNLPLYFTI